MLKATLATGLAALVFGACWDGTRIDAPEERRAAERTGRVAARSVRAGDRAGAERRRVDPRVGGFEIGLAEWALAPEAPAIRPGDVTFVLRNRGTMAHGFEIALEGDSSGSGSGDLYKAETGLLEPGQATRLRLRLPPGLYKIECLVEGHDDMGMEAVLEVSAEAPLVSAASPPPPGRIAIEGFAFTPEISTVESGTEVTWRNDDATAHTVTAVDGEFGSDTLEPGDSFSIRLRQPGVYDYRCAIHPEMTGALEVE